MIKFILSIFVLSIGTMSTFAQCNASIRNAELHWKNGKFGEAINELLLARDCEDKQIARNANSKILEYSKNMEELNNALKKTEGDLTKTKEKLESTNTTLKTEKENSDRNALIARQAAGTAQQAEQKAITANRNFYNGLIILFDYLSMTGHAKNFTEWASNESHSDSLRKVLLLMIDNSPAMREKGAVEIQQWKSTLSDMRPESLAQLFTILGSEVSRRKNIDLSNPEIWKEVEAYLSNSAPRLALNKLLHLEATNKSLQLYENIVLSYRRLNMLDSAEHFAYKMLQLRPNSSLSLMTMRSVKASQKDFRSAEYYAKRVIDAKNAESEPLKVNDFANLSYYQLFSGDYQGALLSADTAYGLEKRNWVLVNRAHALLFLNRQNEAFQLYSDLKNRSNDTSSGSGTLKKVILTDLEEMESLGVNHSNFNKLREQLR